MAQVQPPSNSFWSDFNNWIEKKIPRKYGYAVPPTSEGDHPVTKVGRTLSSLIAGGTPEEQVMGMFPTPIATTRLKEAMRILDEINPKKGGIPYYAKMHQEMYPPRNQYRMDIINGVRLPEPRIYINQAMHKMPADLDERYIRATLGDYRPSLSYDQPAGFITPEGNKVGFGRGYTHQGGMEDLLQAEAMPGHQNSFNKYHSLWYDNPMRMQDVYDLPESLTDTGLVRYATSRVAGHSQVPASASPESLDALYRVMGRPQGPVNVAIPDKIKKIITDRRAGGFDPERYGTFNVFNERKGLPQLLEDYFSNYAEDVKPLMSNIKREVNRR